MAAIYEYGVLSFFYTQLTQHLCQSDHDPSIIYICNSLKREHFLNTINYFYTLHLCLFNQQHQNQIFIVTFFKVQNYKTQIDTFNTKVQLKYVINHASVV